MRDVFLMTIAICNGCSITSKHSLTFITIWLKFCPILITNLTFFYLGSIYVTSAFWALVRKLLKPRPPDISCKIHSHSKQLDVNF